jgi:hypothetical protein
MTTKSLRRHTLHQVDICPVEPSGAHLRLAVLSRHGYLWKTMQTKKRSSARSESAFLEGMASVFDLYGTRFRSRKSRRRTDADAMAGDWQRVGSDLYRAAASVKSESKSE